MIEIVDNYKVLVDDYNYTLIYDTGKTRERDGKVEHVYKYLGYYGTLEKAVEACYDILLRNGMKERSLGLPEAVHSIKETTRSFRQYLHSIFDEDDLK